MDPSEVGVEEEFLLVDPKSGEPLAANRAVADEADQRGVIGRGPRLQLAASVASGDGRRNRAARHATAGGGHDRVGVMGARRAVSPGRASTLPVAGRRWPPANCLQVSSSASSRH